MPVARLAAERSKHIETPWPGWQSYRQVVERTRDFLRHRSHDGRILVISHSANRWALQHLLHGVSLEDLVDAPFDWQPGWTFNVPEGWGRQPDPRNDNELRERTRELAATIVAGTAYPYLASLDIYEMIGRVFSELAYRLLLVWGALTDWVELRPQEKAQAESRMRYFDHWVHDILGYDRDPRESRRGGRRRASQAGPSGWVQPDSDEAIAVPFRCKWWGGEGPDDRPLVVLRRCSHLRHP